MIEISEISPPIKLSGISSISVKFDYNPEIIEVLKQFSPAVWHKKEGIWEISSSYLSRLLDQLTYFDDIKLTLLANETSEISKVSEAEFASLAFTPFEHQKEAIEYGISKKKWLNLFSMGLGKTCTLIGQAEILHKRGLIDHCLIICGVDSLRQQWAKECRKFSHESALVLGERRTKSGKLFYASIAERAKQLMEPIDEFFVITNISSLRDGKLVEAFKKSKNKFGLICLDEAHRVATKSSQQGSNLLKLTAEYKVAMSGSLVTNSPLSCYVPLVWTENEHATLTNYKAQYCNFGGFNNSQIIGYKNLDLLKEEINSCSIRKTFDQVKPDMPEKTIEYEFVEMSDEHRKFYEAIKNGVKEEADKIQLNSGNLLALTTRLRQATSAPSVLTSHQVESSKILRAAELAEDLLESGEKVIIFSTFVEPCEVLAEKLSRFNPLLGTGKQSQDLVDRNVEKFRDSGDFNLLIGTQSKLGTGFNMPECHYSILLDQPWTDATFSQVCDRIYRINSDQHVFIKVLICVDTIDERVKEIVDTKREIADYLIDANENVLAQQLQDDWRNIILSL